MAQAQAKTSKVNAATCSKNSGLGICPISFQKPHELAEDQMFRVCADPTFYEVNSLYEWVFTRGNKLYPHSKLKISKTDKARLWTAYQKNQTNSLKKSLNDLISELNPELNPESKSVLGSTTKIYDNKPFGEWLRYHIVHPIKNIIDYELVTTEFYDIGGDVDSNNIIVSDDTKFDGFSIMIDANMNVSILTSFPVKYGSQKYTAVLCITKLFQDDVEYLIDLVQKEENVQKIMYNPRNEQLLFKDENFSFTLNQTGGSKQKEYKTYQKKRYLVRRGPRGGKYIVVKGDKIYI